MGLFTNSCDPFDVRFSGSAQDLFDKLQEQFQKKGWFLEGNSTKSDFELSIPIIGKVTGTLLTVGQTATVKITKKRRALKCSLIQSTIESQIASEEVAVVDL